jgi:hypothetical protein
MVVGGKERTVKRILVILVVRGLSVAWLPSTAGAEEEPSCVGVLARVFAADGAAAEVEMLKALADALGLTFGQAVSMVANEHGTLEECLALIGNGNG